MITYSTTEARAKLSDLVNKVKYQKKIIAIGRNNKAEVLITPIPEDIDNNITDINAQSPSFDFLENEPNIYTLKDIQKKYV